MAAPALAASIDDRAICSGVTGTAGLRPGVSAEPVTAHEMMTLRCIVPPRLFAARRRCCRADPRAILIAGRDDNVVGACAKNGNDHERQARVHPASPDRRGRQGDGGLLSQTIAGNNWNLAAFGDTPMTPKSGQIRIGIGGWTFEPWRGVFYPQGAAAREGARLRQRAADLDRGQRHVLPLADAGDVPQMGERGAAEFRVRAQGPALCRQPARAQGGRRLDQALSRFRHHRAWRPSRAAALAIRADQKIRRRRFRRLPRIVAGQTRRPRAAPRHRSPPRQFLHRPNSWRCCANSKCRSCSPTTPNIRISPTSPATSSMPACSAARIRCRPLIRRKTSPPGPAACNPGRKARRRTTCPMSKRRKKAKAAPRDVFAYVIHEGKVRAPAAAMALIERLGNN